MATSGSYDFTITRDQIIAGALRLLGVIGQGDTPDAAQLSDCSEALNLLIKAWEAEGLPLWSIKIQAIPVAASTTSYTIGVGQTINVAKPLKVYQAYYRNATSNVDIPMTSLSQQEYNMLGNKSTLGTPVQFYYENLRDYGKLYLFPTPSAADVGNNVYITYQCPFEDFDSGTNNPDIPQEFYRALKYGLAADLVFEFGYPSEDRRDLINMAERYKQQAFMFNQEEESLTFQVNTRKW